MRSKQVLLLAKDVDVCQIELSDEPTEGPIHKISYSTHGSTLLVQTPPGLSCDHLIREDDKVLFDIKARSSSRFVKIMQRIDEHLKHKMCELFPKTVFTSTFDSKNTMQIEACCPIQDVSGNDITLQKDNAHGAHIQAIVKCTGVWHIAGRAGVVWEPVLIRYEPPLSFLNEEDQETEQEEEDQNQNDRDPKHDQDHEQVDLSEN